MCLFGLKWSNANREQRERPLCKHGERSVSPQSALVQCPVPSERSCVCCNRRFVRKGLETTPR